MGGITTEDMARLEENTVEKGISLLQLMENAGRKVFDVLSEKDGLDKKKILVVCYHGNNGGDGFVAARYLADVSEVDVLFIGDEEKLGPEALENYNRVVGRYDIQIFKDFDIDFGEYDIVIDAMLGTGVEGELREPVVSVIDMINNSKGFKVCIDVPTGVDPDSGKSLGKSVNPDLLITMHAMKKGLEAYKDKTEVVDIGILE